MTGHTNIGCLRLL